MHNTKSVSHKSVQLPYGGGQYSIGKRWRQE